MSCSLASVPHPALRAIFSFLTSKDESYTSVLEEDGLLLVDRYLLELSRNIVGTFINLIIYHSKINIQAGVRGHLPG